MCIGQMLIGAIVGVKLRLATSPLSLQLVVQYRPRFRLATVVYTLSADRALGAYSMIEWRHVTIVVAGRLGSSRVLRDVCVLLLRLCMLGVIMRQLLRLHLLKEFLDTAATHAPILQLLHEAVLISTSGLRGKVRQTLLLDRRNIDLGWHLQISLCDRRATLKARLVVQIFNEVTVSFDCGVVGRGSPHVLRLIRQLIVLVVGDLDSARFKVNLRCRVQ